MQVRSRRRADHVFTFFLAFSRIRRDNTPGSEKSPSRRISLSPLVMCRKMMEWRMDARLLPVIVRLVTIDLVTCGCTTQSARQVSHAHSFCVCVCVCKELVGRIFERYFCQFPLTDQKIVCPGANMKCMEVWSHGAKQACAPQPSNNRALFYAHR